MVSVNWVGLDELYRAVENEPENYTPSLKAGITTIKLSFVDGNPANHGLKSFCLSR
jgi:hypothetical protein